MSESYNVYPESGENVYEKLAEDEVKIGDTISIITNNPEGYVKYEVVNLKNYKMVLFFLFGQKT